MRLSRSRRGSIAPLLAFSSVALFSFVALAIDMGMITVARTQCQNAADSAALAGTRLLNNKPSTVDNNRPAGQLEATASAVANQYLNQYFTSANVTLLQTGLFRYNPTQQRFYAAFTQKDVNPAYPNNTDPVVKATGESWTATKVTVQGNQSAYFSQLFGITSLNTNATAVAVHRPRDVAFVLDFSGSMRFASLFNWAYYYQVTGNPNPDPPPDGGMLNPDPDYPRFGHYQRYDAYQTTDPSANPRAATPSTRPNPLRITGPYVNVVGEAYSPNNFTIPTSSGPPIAYGEVINGVQSGGFFFDPANVNSPSTMVSTVTPANLKLAFKRFNPPMVSAGNPTTYTAPTYDFSNYNALDLTGVSGPLPAPHSYQTQAKGSNYAYFGDLFPRKNGQLLDDGSSWDPTTSTGAARNLAEFLGWVYVSGTTLGYPALTTPTVNVPGTVATPFWNAKPTTLAGWASQTSNYPLQQQPRQITRAQSSAMTTPLPTVTNSDPWLTFRDATWEQYGYDLDVVHYIANRGMNWNPQIVFPNAQMRTTKFQGYSMGPGYWGKTFFMWPPDPRHPSVASVPFGDPNYVAGDWRERFFTFSPPAMPTITAPPPPHLRLRPRRRPAAAACSDAAPTASATAAEAPRRRLRHPRRRHRLRRCCRRRHPRRRLRRLRRSDRVPMRDCRAEWDPCSRPAAVLLDAGAGQVRQRSGRRSPRFRTNSLCRHLCPRRCSPRKRVRLRCSCRQPIRIRVPSISDINRRMFRNGVGDIERVPALSRRTTVRFCPGSRVVRKRVRRPPGRPRGVLHRSPAM
ncbi:MAG: pilus assembly protein TadG-related protein [Gemmataceae bacterium]